MGSAFQYDGLASSDSVLLSLADNSDDPMIAHAQEVAGDRCRRGAPPHRMSECGRFTRRAYPPSLREQALAAIAEAPSIERCQQILFDVVRTNAESRTRRLVRQAVERRARALRIADIAGVRP